MDIELSGLVSGAAVASAQKLTAARLLAGQSTGAANGGLAEPRLGMPLAGQAVGGTSAAGDLLPGRVLGGESAGGSIAAADWTRARGLSGLLAGGSSLSSNLQRGRFISAGLAVAAKAGAQARVAGAHFQDVYLEVTGSPVYHAGSQAEGKPGTWRLPVTLRAGGVAGTRIPVGTSLVRWGKTGGAQGTFTGGLLLTADLDQAPYLDIFTVARGGGSDPKPWQTTALKPRVRVGNLDGVLGLAEQWGLAAGTDLSDSSKPHLKISNLGALLKDIDLNVINGTVYFGDAGQTKYMKWQSSLLEVKGTVKADSGYLGNLSIDGLLTIGTGGELRQGSGTLGSSFTGLRMWREGSIGRIAGYNNNVAQWYAGTDGKLYAGAGKVLIDSNGVLIDAGTGSNNKIRWKIVASGLEAGSVNVQPTSSTHALILKAENTSVQIGGTNSNGGLLADALTAKGGVLYNSLWQGDWGVGYQQVYAFVPLSAPLTNAAWTSSVRSTTARTLVNARSVFGVPAAAKALYLRVSARDSGSASTDCQINFFHGDSAVVMASVDVNGQANNTWERESLIVNLNSSGQFAYNINASGSGTFTVTVEVWGYFV